MARVQRHPSGKGKCPDCGVELPIPDLLTGSHECDPDHRAAHQGEVLAEEIAEFLASSAGQSRLAFAHWCRVQGRA